jgi:NAD(P)-dependent dehydrogenase (short-subunit alcohol dehydrogenase family)
MSTWSQLFPPSPTFTDADIPSQAGKVFIVTGGASGIGLALSKFLYQKGGKVYIAGRSEENAQKAIEEITADNSSHEGIVEFLFLDLADLSTIKKSAETFKSKESRLDVLWNNAGLSLPPAGSTSKQGYDLTVATNCLGPFLFTQLLLSVMESTSKLCPPGTVRAVWTASIVADGGTPTGGIDMSTFTTLAKQPSGSFGAAQATYATTKLGNWFIGSELSRRWAQKHNIISVTQNPGNLSTNLTRHRPYLKYLFGWMLSDSKFGGYTELYAGLSPDVPSTVQGVGTYVLPWGRLQLNPREDLVKAMLDKESGGEGSAMEFWDWCENEVKSYK